MINRYLLLTAFIIFSQNIYSHASFAALARTDQAVYQDDGVSQSNCSYSNVIDPVTNLTIVDANAANAISALANFFGGSSDFGKGGVTGNCSGSAVPGARWVQKIDAADSTIEVCYSVWTFFMNEGCAKLHDGDKSTIKGIKFRVRKQYFDYLVDSGVFSGSSVATAKKMHSQGYVYTLYNNKCPYIGPDGITPISGDGDSASCKPNTANAHISSYTTDNNCRLLKDSLGLDLGCLSVDKCPGTMPSMTSNTWRSLSPEIQQCYICNKNANDTYTACKNAVNNINSGNNGDKEINNLYYKTTDTNIKRKLEANHGAGDYLCAYEEVVSNRFLSRAGCMKVPLLKGPRPYPRIIYSNTSPFINNILRPPVPRVRQFNSTINQDIPCSTTLMNSGIQVTSSQNSAQHFSTIPGYQRRSIENGEEYRGTFFRPIIIIAYGDQEYPIQFQYTNYEQTYGSKATNSPFQPAVGVTYGLLDLSSCTMNSGSNYPLMNICTRIENNNGAEVYAAYLSNNASCGDGRDLSNLTFIGSVTRPPLKYSYDNNGHPVTSITLANTMEKGAVTNNTTITIKPNGSDSAVVAAHSETVKPDFLNLDAPSVQQALQRNENCAFIFNHNFCADREECAILYAIRPEIRMEKAGFTCSSESDVTRCNLEKEIFNGNSSNVGLKDKCALKMMCTAVNPNSDTAPCYGGPTYNQSIAIDTEKLSKDSAFYLNNLQWQDKVCLSSGFNFADSVGTTGNTSTTLFGQYGDPQYDMTIRYAPSSQNTTDTSIPRMPFGTVYSTSEFAQSLIPVPSNQNTITAALLTTYITSGIGGALTDASTAYLSNNNCPNGNSSCITTASRTPAEMGLCVEQPKDCPGTQMNNISWPSTDNNQIAIGSCKSIGNTLYVMTNGKGLDINPQGKCYSVKHALFAEAGQGYCTIPDAIQQDIPVSSEKKCNGFYREYQAYNCSVHEFSAPISGSNPGAECATGYTYINESGTYATGYCTSSSGVITYTSPATTTCPSGNVNTIPITAYCTASDGTIQYVPTTSSCPDGSSATLASAAGYCKNDTVTTYVSSRTTNCNTIGGVYTPLPLIPYCTKITNTNTTEEECKNKGGIYDANAQITASCGISQIVYVNSGEACPSGSSSPTPTINTITGYCENSSGNIRDYVQSASCPQGGTYTAITDGDIENFMCHAPRPCLSGPGAIIDNNNVVNTSIRFSGAFCIDCDNDRANEFAKEGSVMGATIATALLIPFAGPAIAAGIISGLTVSKASHCNQSINISPAGSSFGKSGKTIYRNQSTFPEATSYTVCYSAEHCVPVHDKENYYVTYKCHDGYWKIASSGSSKPTNCDVNIGN